MKEIFTGDVLLKTVAGVKEVSDGTNYKWSDFTVPFTHKGEAYLYNTLCKKCYAVGEDKLNTDKTVRFAADEIRQSETLTKLVAEQFLVPENRDEAAYYENIIKIARLLTQQRTPKGYRAYTILPTTACNARCVYCFEQGFKYVTMTDECVEQMIRFILDTRCKDGKPIRIRWFGGEPLICEKIIDKVSAALREAGVAFYASMVSNGSLITEDIIRKMNGDWNLRHIQITLDGVEEEYNRRKNYYFNYESAYWHVLSRLKLLNEKTNMSISVRVNVDSENIDGVRQMLRELDPFLPNKERVGISISPLYGIRKDGKDLEVLEKSQQLYVDIEKAGYYLSLKYPVKGLKLNYCMADSPRSNVVIGPDGKIFNCENVQAFPPLGDIWSGMTNKDLYQDLMRVEPVADKCRGCAFLPDCTSFSRCSHIVLNCKRTMNDKMLYTLKQRLEKKLAYEEEAEEDC